MPLNRFGPFGLSPRNRGNSAIDLRPCQRAYLGESNARRLLKRSHLTMKARARNGQDNIPEEPIFAFHEETALEVAAIATAAPTGYTANCYATFAEDEKRRLDAEAADKEKLVLFSSINSSRNVEGKPPVRLKPLLSEHAQDYADMLLIEERARSQESDEAPNSTVMVVMAPSGSRVARIVSPPKIGALACGEMWYGGKYRRHLYPLEGERPHPEDCPCHLRIVFETMVDQGWKAIGIGRGEDSRWVVEFAE